MKKLVSSLFVLLLIFTTFSTAFAEYTYPKKTEQKILFEAKEITNLNTLEQRAKNGISDKNVLPFNSEGKIVDEKTKKPYQEKTIQTTQKLRTVLTNDNIIVDSYATTIFTYGLNITNENNNGIVDTLLSWADGLIFGNKVEAASKSDSTNGVSYTVKSYSTIYWDTRTNPSNSYQTQYRFNRVTGGWTLLDSSFTLSNRKVVYGQTYPFGSNRATGYPSSNSFTYYASSSWGWVTNGTLGATTYVTIKRGTSSTVQGLTNNKAY